MPQGTIKHYDEKTKIGSLLTDQGEEFPFDGDSFSGSGIRLFRIGQRVRYESTGEDTRKRVTNLSIITL